MPGKTLTQGKPWKLVMAFALPVLMGSLLQQLYNTVDTIIVGNFMGEAALSAVGTTSSLTMMFLALAQGFSAGAGVIASQLFGANKKNELRKNALSGIFLLLGMGVLSTLLGIVLCVPVFRYILLVPETLQKMAISYFRIYAAGLVFQFGYNIVAALLRSVGDSKATLYLLLVASILNTILDLLFVAVFHWGVAGAAVATVISQICSCVAGFLYMWKKYPLFRWKRQELIFEWREALMVLKMGMPMAFQQLIVSFGFFFIQRAVNGYGPAMTASFTVEQRIEGYMLMPAIAFQVTMATYTGQNIGAGKRVRVLQGNRQTLGLSVGITLLLSFAAFFFTQPIIGLFSLTEEALGYCTQHLQAMAFSLLIFAVYFPVMGVFQGIGSGFCATLVSTVALGGRVLFTYGLPYLFPSVSYASLWWGQICGWILAAILTYLIYFIGKRKTLVHI